MLLGTLGAVTSQGRGIRTRCYQEFSIQPHSLTTFEISKYYRNEHRFNGVSSRDNLPNKGWDMYNKS